MHTPRHFAAAVAVATAAATTACAPTDPAPEAAAPPPVEVTDRHKLPTADSLDVDMGNPDAVAKAFVEVVESHDAGSDSTEWISVKRADSLMTPQARETYLSYTDGGVDTDWDVWRDAKAITHPAVSLHDAPKPKDTPTTAYRVVLAQLNVQPDDPAAGRSGLEFDARRGGRTGALAENRAAQGHWRRRYSGTGSRKDDFVNYSATAAGPNRHSSRVSSNSFVWPRRQEEPSDVPRPETVHGLRRGSARKP